MTSWFCFDYFKGHPFIGKHERCDGYQWSMSEHRWVPCDCSHHHGEPVGVGAKLLSPVPTMSEAAKAHP